MTRDIIALLINDVKEGYPSASTSELLDTLKTTLGASYDDFMENAMNNRVEDIVGVFSKYGFLPVHQQLLSFLNNFIVENCNLFLSVDDDYRDISVTLSDYAYKFVAEEFNVPKEKVEFLWDCIAGQDEYEFEWNVIEYVLIKNGTITDIPMDTPKAYIESRLKEWLSEDVKVADEPTQTSATIINHPQRYNELTATIRTDFAMVFAILNTQTYNGDMGVTIESCSTPLALKAVGFSDSECETIAKLKIGESCMSEEYGNGVVVVRMA